MPAIRVADVFLLATATLFGLLMLALQAWTPMWWAGLLATTFTIVAAVLHMTLGGSAKRIVNLTLLAFLIIGGPWFGYWYWSNYPASFTIMQTRFPALYAAPKIPIPPAALPPKKLEATAGRANYKCKTDGTTPTPEQAAKDKADFQSYIAAWANFHGFKAPLLSEVPGGLKAEVPSLTAYSEPSKRTFQIVKIGKELFGTYSADYVNYNTAATPMTPNSPLESQVHKAIEGLAKVETGDCELQ
jgi:hypothetical protein